jgi:hypothetical protein
MGDLIGSETAPSASAVHRAFNKAIDAANRAHASSVASPFTITLGDEFQGLLHRLVDAWDVAMELRLRLLVAQVPCRFVIGTTELATPLNEERAWNMMGLGLSAARAKLNDKRSIAAYRFSLPREPIIESLMDAIGHALTRTELEWTSTQLQYYVKVRESKRTNAQTAQALGVTTRSLYKVLRAAQADFHRQQSAALRNALGGLDERIRM